MKDWELIIRYLNGESSQAEKEKVEKALADDADFTQDFEKVRQVWGVAGQPSPSGFAPSVDAAWNKFKTASGIEEVQPKQVQRSLVWRWASIAAMLVLAAGLGFLSIQFNWLAGDQVTVANTDQRIMEVALADGSTVWLGRGGEISYPASFTDSTREVTLTGKAFFDIERDPNRPFRIQAIETEVEVLGTSFSVEANPSREVAVVVVTGKVSFSKGEEKLYLEPGERGQWDPGNNTLIESNNTETNFLAWKTGEMVFARQPLSEVAKTLESYFGQEFQLATSLEDCTFTGDFDQPTLEEVLEVFSIGAGISSERNPDGAVRLTGSCD